MSDDGSSRDQGGPPYSSPDAELAARLKRLERRLEETGPRGSARDPGAGAGGSSPIGAAIRYSAEFAGGPIVGAGLGFALDKGLGVSPWGMVVFLALGFAAGVYNVLRSSGFLRPAGDPAKHAGSDEQA